MSTVASDDISTLTERELIEKYSTPAGLLQAQKQEITTALDEIKMARFFAENADVVRARVDEARRRLENAETLRMLARSLVMRGYEPIRVARGGSRVW